MTLSLSFPSLAHSSQLGGRDTDPPFAQFHPDLELLDHSFLFLQLDEQAEAIELANSVLIEVRFFAFFTFLHSPAQLAILLLSFQISKASVKNWQSKLQTRYGWFKKENCKNIIFDVSIPVLELRGCSHIMSANFGGFILCHLLADPPSPLRHLLSSFG